VTSCGACLRWRRLKPPKKAPPGWFSRFGFCRWPGTKPAPYWHAENPDGLLVIPDGRDVGCPAFKPRRS
jgi:hypothetical protein